MFYLPREILPAVSHRMRVAGHGDRPSGSWHVDLSVGYVGECDGGGYGVVGYGLVRTEMWGKGME